MTTIRLGVDARMIAHSGIGRYTRELLTHAVATDPTLHLVLAGNPPAIRGAVPTLAASARVTVVAAHAPIYSLREQIAGALLFGSLKADVLFFPHYNAPAILGKRYLVTIHDVNHIRRPDTFGALRSRLARALMARVAARAARVLTGSATMRDELGGLFPGTGAKIDVIPHGVSRCFRPASPRALEDRALQPPLPPRYVVTVGNRRPLKNLGTAAEAIRLAQDAVPGLAWVVVGDRIRQDDEVDEFANAGGRVLQLFGIPDEVLRFVYAGSVALLMPSLFEGFGLPVIEAMACGTPVVASNIPAIREVAGNAAVLCDPMDAKGLGAAIVRLALDGDARSRLVGLGLERARRYDWDEAARSFIRAVRQVAGTPA